MNTLSIFRLPYSYAMCIHFAFLLLDIELLNNYDNLICSAFKQKQNPDLENRTEVETLVPQLLGFLRTPQCFSNI